MPIEVYSIEGSYLGRYIDHQYRDRTPEEVAEDIRNRYQKIVDASGRVVAGHEVSHKVFGNHGVDESYIYIVANIPGADVELV